MTCKDLVKGRDHGGNVIRRYCRVNTGKKCYLLFWKKKIQININVTPTNQKIEYVESDGPHVIEGSP